MFSFNADKRHLLNESLIGLEKTFHSTVTVHMICISIYAPGDRNWMWTLLRGINCDAARVACRGDGALFKVCAWRSASLWHYTGDLFVFHHQHWIWMLHITDSNDERSSNCNDEIFMIHISNTELIINWYFCKNRVSDKGVTLPAGNTRKSD